MCGEHQAGDFLSVGQSGSSPRVRGTQLAVVRFDAFRVDHPRVCGEHSVSPPVTAASRGSSPRVRGTLEETADDACAGGIIPACAGNTEKQSTFLRADRDHPRVCGEHVVCVLCCLVVWGSSPRVRGTHMKAGCNVMTTGIIPACAGNTGAARCPGTCSWDHPRVCGEHQAVFCKVRISLGSSPRVRGTLQSTLCVGTTQGIIPACAGNTTLAENPP